MKIKHINCSYAESVDETDIDSVRPGEIDCEHCKEYREFSIPNLFNVCNNGTLISGTKEEINDFNNILLLKCKEILTKKPNTSIPTVKNLVKLELNKSED